MPDWLDDIVARNRAGQALALTSVCTAHPDVLRASLMRAEALDVPVAIEATSNQVNQDGGYTGLTPAGFLSRVRDIAAAAGVDPARIVFGGDHLGPQAWRGQPADAAMAKAREMVAGYAAAGFTKIHLDCSEGCAGEPAAVGDAVAAARAADLARVCLGAAPDPALLRFVIGTEVPPPGGARSDDDGIAPTTPAAARATLDAHRAAFTSAGLAGLGQVAGLVVQPGVEFTPMTVHHLPDADPGLRAVASDIPGLVLEAHSTDYQHPAAFHRLAGLGFGFLKVGPALTFAWRQAVYALDQLRALAGWGASVIPATMEAEMLAEPRYWQGHYHGADLRLQRHFALADRIRYYWPRPAPSRAMAALFADLATRRLPDPLLWQAFPPALLDRAETLPGPRAEALVAAAVQEALDPYLLLATGAQT